MWRSSMIVLGCFLSSAGPGQAQEVCGRPIKVLRGDTLSAISDRCGVDERQLIEANSSINGSGDLRAGMELKVDSQHGVDRAVDALGSAAGQTAGWLSGLAESVKTSADDLVRNNPDLRRRIDKLTGDLQDAPRWTGSLDVTPNPAAPNESLVIRADGLPANQPVVIGVGQPQSAYEVLSHDRTDAKGRLTTKLELPGWAAAWPRATVVVASEKGDQTIRSKPLQVLAP